MDGNEFQTELLNLLVGIIAWTVMVVGIIFLAFKSGEMVDFVKDMIRSLRRR